MNKRRSSMKVFRFFKKNEKLLRFRNYINRNIYRELNENQGFNKDNYVSI